MPIEVCFPENEAARILWTLIDAIDLARETDALASLAMYQGMYASVRRRYDARGER